MSYTVLCACVYVILEMNKALSVFYLVASMATLVLILTGALQQYWIVRLVFKLAPMVVLILGRYMESGLLNLTAALIFSLVGDAFLVFESDVCFLLGILAFLVAHVCYIWYFKLPKPSLKSLVLIPVVYGPALSIYFLVLFPKIKKVQIEATVYMAVLITMAYVAINTLSLAVIGGALVFLASDFVLALQRFSPPKIPPHYMSFVVMSTYYLAQFLLSTPLRKQR